MKEGNLRMVNYPQNIHESGYTIYEPVDSHEDWLYIPTGELERILSSALVGVSLEGLPLRTRSKIVKEKICEALGYPVPTSFRKTQPRFLGQNFDVYTQKSLNVQIWNEEIDPQRRYVFLRTDQYDTITKVRVIEGAELAKYDKTGTLTHKYQARMQSYDDSFSSSYDTQNVRSWILPGRNDELYHANPTWLPSRTQLLPIEELFDRLIPMVGKSINYLDAVQERNRGAELHALICEHLGYSIYEDDGSYPDITNQLLEVKLQTSPTIDLGLHSPEDGQKILSVSGMTFFSQDIRYAIFDGEVSGDRVWLNNLYIVTGEEFSRYFPLFKGMGINAKIQIPLPGNFFD